MRYLLIGNYGTSNLGDEALKDYFLQTFPEVEWVVACHGEPHVISSSTRDVMVRRAHHDIVRLPFGLRSLFFTPWWRTVHAYARCDGVVFGGGSLFTDVESVWAPILWWWHAVVAWVLRKPIFLAFQGVGPFRTNVGEWLSAWVIRHARFVSVRDHQSFERVRKWRSDVVESFDPVFCVILRSPVLCMVRDASLLTMTQRAGRLEGRAESEGQTQQTFVIIPRSNSDSHFVHRAHNLCQQKQFENIFILSLQPNSASEKTVCKNIQDHIPGSQTIPIHSLQELSQIIVSASFVLSQRFHGALAALALGIPFDTVPQTMGDKLMALKTMSKEEALTLVEQGEKALRSSLNA